MSHLTKAQITEQLLKGSGQAGSGGRSRALGENDPRHRRGAQSEGVAMQRFDPDQFKVDDEQRVTLVDPPSSRVYALATATGGAVSGQTSYTDMPLTATANAFNTEKDDLITISSANANITLRAGRVYRVDAEGMFVNISTTVNGTGSLQVIRGDGSGTTHGARNAVQLGLKPTVGKSSRTSISTSGVIDLREATEDMTISVQVKGSTGNINIESGWATIQTL